MSGTGVHPRGIEHADDRHWFNPMPFLETLGESVKGAAADVGKTADWLGETLGMDEDTFDYDRDVREDAPSFVGATGDLMYSMNPFTGEPVKVLSDIATGPGGFWNLASLLTPAKAVPKSVARPVVKPLVSGLEKIYPGGKKALHEKLAPARPRMVHRGPGGQFLGPWHTTYGPLPPTKTQSFMEWAGRPLLPSKKEMQAQRKLRPFTEGQRGPGGVGLVEAVGSVHTEPTTLSAAEAMEQLNRLKGEQSALVDSTGPQILDPLMQLDPTGRHPMTSHIPMQQPGLSRAQRMESIYPEALWAQPPRLLPYQQDYFDK